MQLTLLGRFSFLDRHDQAGLQSLQESPRLQELLAYLLMHAERPIARAELAEQVWDGHPASQAYAYACKALARLKAILEPENLTFCDDTNGLQWNHNADLQIDVRTLERLLTEASSGPAERLDRHALKRFLSGVDLYRGPFLDGFYNSWCSEIRDHLEQQFLELLDIVMAACEQLGDYDSGITCGLHALRLEPSRESAHQRLMRLFHLAGDRTSALRQYRRCVEALADDLNTQPGQETIALYRQLQTGGQLPLSHPGALPASFHKTLTNLHALDHAVSQLQAIQLPALIGNRTQPSPNRPRPSSV